MTDEAEAKRFEEITSYHIDAVKRDYSLSQEEKDAAQKANDEHLALLKGLEKETIAYTDAGIALDYAAKDAHKAKLRADFDRAEHALEEGIARKLGNDPQAEERIKGALSVPDTYIQESVSGNAQEVRAQSGSERNHYLEQAAKYFEAEGAIDKAKLHVDEATMDFIQQARVEGLKLGIPKEKFDDVAANVLSRAEGVPDSFLNQDPQVKDWEAKLRGATGEELGKLGEALQAEKTASYKF